jgi:hypothetical protein
MATTGDEPGWGRCRAWRFWSNWWFTRSNRGRSCSLGRRNPPLDRKPVELRTILLTQLDLERILGKQLVLDRQRQVPALDEFRNFFFCPQTTLEPLLSDIGRLSVA